MSTNHSYKHTRDTAINWNCNSQAGHQFPLPRQGEGFTVNPNSYWTSFQHLKQLIDNMYYQRSQSSLGVQCGSQQAITCPSHSGSSSSSGHSFKQKYDEINSLKRCQCYNREYLVHVAILCGCEGHGANSSAGSCSCNQQTTQSNPCSCQGGQSTGGGVCECHGVSNPCPSNNCACHAIVPGDGSTTCTCHDIRTCRCEIVYPLPTNGRSSTCGSVNHQNWCTRYTQAQGQTCSCATRNFLTGSASDTSHVCYNRAGCNGDASWCTDLPSLACPMNMQQDCTCFWVEYEPHNCGSHRNCGCMVRGPSCLCNYVSGCSSDTTCQCQNVCHCQADGQCACHNVDTCGTHVDCPCQGIDQCPSNTICDCQGVANCPSQCDCQGVDTCPSNMVCNCQNISEFY